MLIHKLYSNVIVPKRQTDLSACYDIHSHLRSGVISEDRTPEFRKIKMIDRMNHMTEIMPEVTWDSDTPHTTITIPANTRALIPTGIIFEAPGLELGNRFFVSPTIASACFQKCEFGSGLSVRSGISDFNNSKTN